MVRTIGKTITTSYLTYQNIT